MKNLFRLLACATLLGCGTAEVGSSAAPEADADALSSSSFYTLRADTRACPSPTCGGYFLHAVNRSRPEVYVATLDFSPAQLSDAELAKVQGAPAAELVLRGKVSARSAAGTRKLMVLDAYRGMPGAVASGRFYAVARSPRQCVVAPCNQLTATALNAAGSSTEFTTLSVASAAVGFVDQEWLGHRVQDNGALVAATLTTGTQDPGGMEQVLDATQVFLHLPETSGPCPMVSEPSCSGGEINTFERNADRCLIPTGCAALGVCSQMRPACASGYSLTSYHTAAGACAHFSCDPDWVLN